jgi:hypothetical protein
MGSWNMGRRARSESEDGCRQFQRFGLGIRFDTCLDTLQCESTSLFTFWTFRCPFARSFFRADKFPALLLLLFIPSRFLPLLAPNINPFNRVQQSP